MAGRARLVRRPYRDTPEPRFPLTAPRCLGRLPPVLGIVLHLKKGLTVIRTLAMVLALLAGLFPGLLGCSREPAPGARAATTAPRDRKVSVAVAPVEGREVQRTVQIVGTLAPAEEATLGVEVYGTVVKILVDLGDPVQAGQTVIQLDDRGARLEVQRAEANLQVARESLGRAQQLLESSRANVDRARAVLADARINLKRFEGLFAEGAISASQRDSAQTQHDVAVPSLRASEAQLESDRSALKAAEASVDQARFALGVSRKLLQDTNVVSPITGVVRKRLVNVGDTFREKTPLMSLVTVDMLKLAGDVPERFAPLVRVGRPVSLEIEAYPGRTFPCFITRVSPSVDVESRSFQVEASVPNAKGLLKPGFFAKASILTGVDRNVPFVPEEAVVSFAGIVKLFVIADSQAVERRVKTGVRRDGRVEILEGVRVGEVVATSSLSQLATGTAVLVQSGAKNGGRTATPAPPGVAGTDAPAKGPTPRP
jgi:RND family efflux transporter MFP subunit